MIFFCFVFFFSIFWFLFFVFVFLWVFFFFAFYFTQSLLIGKHDSEHYLKWKNLLAKVLTFCGCKVLPKNSETLDTACKTNVEQNPDANALWASMQTTVKAIFQGNGKKCVKYVFIQPLWYRQDVRECQFFKGSTVGLNFRGTSCLTKAKEPSLPYYFPVTGNRTYGFVPFQRELACSKN